MYVSANKESLRIRAAKEIGKITGGTVGIGDLSVSVFNNFPFLAIGLQKVDVRDSLFSRHGHRFFYADKIFLRLNPATLLLGRLTLNKLQIDSGGLHLFTDSSGYSNDYLLKGSNKPAAKETDASTANILDKISLNNFAVIIEDVSKAKLFDLYIANLNATTKRIAGTLDITVSESIRINTLAFNQKMGSYLTKHTLAGKYTLQYSPAKKELGFDSIPISISNQPFRFSGLFSFGAVQKFSLRTVTNNITVDFAKSLLTKKTATGISLVNVSKPLNADATLDGSLMGGEPLIVAHWSTEKNSITTPLLNFENCSFGGLYTNEVVKGGPRNDSNSKVEVYHFQGDWQGLTMTSQKMIINNLTIPTLEADLHSRFPLSRLNEIMQTEALSLTAGSGKLDLNYNGPLDKITPQNASLNGLLHIENGNILMRASQSNLSNCHAAIRFRNADLIIDTLTCKIHNDELRFRGEAKNALALLGDAAGGLSLTLDISAPVLNLAQVSSILSRKFPTKSKSRNTKNGGLAKTAQQLDNLLSSGNVAVSLRAGKILYRRFEARNASANIAIDANSWLLKNASLQHGTGNISVTGRVTEQPNKRFVLNASLNMKNVDAQKVWYEFENFGMPALTSKNIRGQLTANAKVSLLLDNVGNLDTKTLNGEADFSIRNGALVDFKPLQDVQAVAFKKRDFSDVSFAEIKDKVTFTNGALQINRMEVNSTVISFFIEGIYAPSGKTDISIQLPLSNLKKRDKEFIPENTGAGRGGGLSVFLRATTADDGTIKIKYDPLGRFRKGPLENIDNKKNNQPN